MTYDVIIIGAGLSGMAAGIRLAQFDKSVCILERHDRIGGLNSYFNTAGRKFDVGLHAMTNFTTREQRRSPLNKILRQLRIPRDELQLCEQRESSIRFPDCTLRFGNDLTVLRNQIATRFPDEIDGFNRLVHAIESFDPGTPSEIRREATGFLDEFLQNDQLKHMIMCPILFYGGATPHDMDWDPFRTLFQAVFLEGLCKPNGGIRTLLSILRQRFRDNGGELRLNTGVATVLHDAGRVVGVETDAGDRVEARAVLSCAGYPETLALTSPPVHPEQTEAEAPGQMAFLESVFVLDRTRRLQLPDEAIIFHNNQPEFHFAPPDDLIDPHSAVVCFPDHFNGFNGTTGETTVRITRIANSAKWFALDDEAYSAAKHAAAIDQHALLDTVAPGAAAAVMYTDVATPRTIHRFTGRFNGAIYGAPVKHPDGLTPLENLFVCGADQGLVGITGTLLSGIAIANRHLLR